MVQVCLSSLSEFKIKFNLRLYIINVTWPRRHDIWKKILTFDCWVFLNKAFIFLGRIMRILPNVLQMMAEYVNLLPTVQTSSEKLKGKCVSYRLGYSRQSNILCLHYSGYPEHSNQSIKLWILNLYLLQHELDKYDFTYLANWNKWNFSHISICMQAKRITVLL
jgi:hypothetical protein